ncbi:MAG: cation diffusion facilitator family transporter [Chthonomonadaceae bacterium]|nr:cation diffusion facilitator family transporter [Chthonomonadaceae bacterium]
MRTVWIALVGNLVVAVAKIVAGLISGSTAMLAEAAHSFADSINEVLLGVSLHRSLKPADISHPYGFGRERFFWAFLAAIASFIVGGCLSVGLAVRELYGHTVTKNLTASWVVLGISLIADGVSWMQSFRQARDEAKEKGRSTWDYLRRSSDPVLRAIVVEDSAALVGIALAAAGLTASKLLGSGVPDATASLLIGLLLAGTAVGLARPLADLLIGRPLPDEVLKGIQKILEASPAIESVVGLHAVYIGPGEAIVLTKIAPSCVTVSELAAAMDDLDHRIRQEVPLVADLFVDVTAQKPDQTALEDPDTHGENRKKRD